MLHQQMHSSIVYARKTTHVPSFHRRTPSDTQIHSHFPPQTTNCTPYKASPATELIMSDVRAFKF